MLVLLPPSEGKAPPGRGRSVDLSRLSFPELTAARDEVLDAIATTSARPDAVARLTAPRGAAREVARNVDVRHLGTMPAERLYTGVLYDALGVATMDPDARRRARRWVVITSALFGAVRLGDPLPPYRLPICGRLDGLPGLEAYWRTHLPPVMTDAVGRGVLVDCRSSSYQPVWRPEGALADRWVQVRVPGASHAAKHTRGLVVRHLCLTGARDRDVPAVAAAVATGFATRLHEPGGPGRPWVLDVYPPA